MNKIVLLIIALLFSACSPLESLNLSTGANITGAASQDAQEQFDIQIVPLTLQNIKQANTASYARRLMVPGSGSNAKLVNEARYLKQNLPPNEPVKEYTLGIGDTLRFVQINEPSRIEQLSTKDNIITSDARVGSDGTILLLGLGRLEVLGRTIDDLRSEVRNILIRSGLSPKFQLEITGFNSQKAYVVSAGGNSKIIGLSDRKISLQEVFIGSSLVSVSSNLTIVKLKRGTKEYTILAEAIFNDDVHDIYLHDDDQIFITQFAYKPEVVYLAGGAIIPQLVKIEPMNRETLADIMFAKGGVVSSPVAQRSEVYLLRDGNPMTAFHLDAQSVSRIALAAKMELRPNDILFVAERPVTSFNRVLADIAPLQVFAKSIKDF